MSRAALQEGKAPMTPWTLLAALPHMIRYYVVRVWGWGSSWGGTDGAATQPSPPVASLKDALRRLRPGQHMSAPP